MYALLDVMESNVDTTISIEPPHLVFSAEILELLGCTGHLLVTGATLIQCSRVTPDVTSGHHEVMRLKYWVPLFKALLQPIKSYQQPNNTLQ